MSQLPEIAMVMILSAVVLIVGALLSIFACIYGFFGAVVQVFLFSVVFFCEYTFLASTDQL